MLSQFLRFLALALTIFLVPQPEAYAASSPIQSFKASPATIQLGASTDLSWSVTNPRSLSISPGVGQITGTSISVKPTATTTYTLTATTSKGSYTAKVKVTVLPKPPTISSFTASATSIQSGASTTLKWATKGATSLSISPTPGTVKGSSAVVNPASTTTYTLTASNAGGKTTATVTVTVVTAPSGLNYFVAYDTQLRGDWDIAGILLEDVEQDRHRPLAIPFLRSAANSSGEISRVS